jgi:hypothetical protein
MKILSQILIVILAVALVAGATYLIVTQTGSSTSVSSDRPAIDGGGQGQGNGTGPGNGQGMRGGGGEGGGSSQAWLEVLKNVGIVAVATVLITLIKRILGRKPRPQLVNG